MGTISLTRLPGGQRSVCTKILSKQRFYSGSHARCKISTSISPRGEKNTQVEFRFPFFFFATGPAIEGDRNDVSLSDQS